MAGPRDKRRTRDGPTQHGDHVRLELECVLRIRPFIKKERGDQVVLEPRMTEDGRTPTAVLHPLIAKQKYPSEIPSMKMLSPETLHLCKDTEYHMNHILSTETDQEKVYYSLGLPMARSAMDFLKFKKSAEGVNRETNVIICMGVENSGKTYSCFGDGNMKRRNHQDGLVPRIVDSLFSQSKHHVKNRRHLSFRVNISLLQVTQSKTDVPTHHDDSLVHDLLSPSLPSKASASPLRSPSPLRLQSVKLLVGRFETVRSNSGSMSGSNRSETDIQVTIHQDPETMDFFTDATVKKCQDVAEARQLLTAGLQAGQRLASKQKMGHVLTILQPVLLGPDGSVEREGGKIAILDMAGVEQASTQKKRGNAVRRQKDSIGGDQNDKATAAVMHCVRSLQHNSMLLSGKTPALDIVDDAYNGMTIDDNTSEISCVSEAKIGKAKGPSFKVVPYRQHNLTMLLQQFFSTHQATTTNLTLLLAAHPGHRDYSEKKALLADFELFAEVARGKQEAAALTGLEKQPLSPIQFSPSSESNASFADNAKVDKQVSPKRSNRMLCKSSPRAKKQTRDEAVIPTAPTLDMAYSLDETEMIPMPPPYAPGVAKPPPTAPTATISMTASSPLVVDFPGVAMPTAHANRQPSSANAAPVPERLETSSYQPLQSTSAHNMQSREAPNSKLTSSDWISGFSGTAKKAFNHVVHESTVTGKKMIEKMMPTPDRTFTSNHDYATTDDNLGLRSTPLVEAEYVEHKFEPSQKSAKKRRVPKKATEDEDNNDASGKHKRLDKLEEKNASLVNRNKELESRCLALEEENMQLKQDLELVQQGHSATRWTVRDEMAYQTSKKHRLAEQQLIEGPLWNHLNDVQSTFNNAGRWNLPSGKQQFGLRFPSYFARASVLDARDSQNQRTSPARAPYVAATATTRTTDPGSGEKRKSQVGAFQWTLENVQRKRPKSLIHAVREK